MGTLNEQELKEIGCRVKRGDHEAFHTLIAVTLNVMFVMLFVIPAMSRRLRIWYRMLFFRYGRIFPSMTRTRTFFFIC